jgi:hypothetical protein
VCFYSLLLLVAQWFLFSREKHVLWDKLSAFLKLQTSYYSLPCRRPPQQPSAERDKIMYAIKPHSPCVYIHCNAFIHDRQHILGLRKGLPTHDSSSICHDVTMADVDRVIYTIAVALINSCMHIVDLL